MKKQKTIIKNLLRAFVIAIVLLEIGSFLLLNLYFKVDKNIRINQELSGYSVFKNSSDFDFFTYKPSDTSKDLHTDRFGFVSNGLDLLNPKKTDEIRIFLTGGSAAFSAGQNFPYDSIHSYPQGTYSYEISIAGFLQKGLQEKFPKKDIHVINAASYNRQYDHSLHQYLAVIEQLSPDLIISFDGFNDLGAKISSTPIKEMLSDITFHMFNQINENKTTKYDCFNTIKLFNLLRLKAMNTKRGPEILPSIYPSLTVKEYENIRPELVSSSQNFVKTVSNFNSILRNDSVNYLFILQPMLGREKNKKLSPTENLFRNTFNPFSNPYIPSDIISKYQISQRFRLDSLNRVTNLCEKYFLDDYLSKTLEQNLVSGGATFIDGNVLIEDLDEKFEVYTDYCHLTIEANKFIADNIADSIFLKKLIR